MMKNWSFTTDLRQKYKKGYWKTWEALG